MTTQRKQSAESSTVRGSRSSGSKLPPKRERFCQEYIKDLNGTQAAIRAGYSKRTANEQAAQLLAIISVKSRVEELKAARGKKTGVTQEWVVEMLQKVAKRCIESKKFDPSPAVQALDKLAKHTGAYEADHRQKITEAMALFNAMQGGGK